VSIYSVAKKAGVSPAAVSRYINKSGSVAPGKAELIRAAMKELEYVPSLVRPGPRLKNRPGVRTGQIALLFLGRLKPLEMYRMPVFPILFSGVHEAVESAGLNLVVTHWPDGEQCPSIIRKGCFDGVLVMGAMPKPERLFSMLKIPAVWFFRGHSDPEGRLDHVFYDNSRIGGIAARYLVGKGCRRLCFINPYPVHEAVKPRKKDFIRTAKDLGSEVKIFESAEDMFGSVVEEAEIMTRKAVGGKDRCDGIFAPMDNVLLSAYNCLKFMGKTPDKEVTLIGCNNDPQFMGQMNPRPATIDIKLDTVGKKAVEQLLIRMQFPDDKDRVEILVKPELVPAEGRA